MQRLHIIIIILFASVSLVGLTTTQSLWVWNAVKLGEQQHEHRIDDSAVKSVLDPDLQAKTPFGRICEEFYLTETFTPRFIKAMKIAYGRM